MRREAVAAALNRLIDGDAGLLLSPACTMLRKGFVGGYHYRRVRAGANPDTYYESPVKNTYSHPHDALQYLLLELSHLDFGIMASPAFTLRSSKRCL